MEADFILSLKSLLDNDNRYDNWFPNLLAYKGWHNNRPFPIFLRSESKRYFEIVKNIFHVNNKEELIEKYNRANKVTDFEKWNYNYRSIPFQTYMNLDKLFEV